MGGMWSDDKIVVMDHVYLKGRLLGKGSHGKVTAIQHSITKRWKVMKEVSANSPDLLAALHERTILSYLQACPFVPRLFCAVRQERTFVMVMQYCSGGELRYHLTHQRFELNVVKHLLSHLVVGIMDIHAMGVMHRDLNLRNILLDNLGYAIITDFNTSYKMIEKQSEPNSEHKILVKDDNPEKIIYGTFPYIAPELLTGSPHDEGVDWWSLGIVAYELLYGHPPWKPVHGGTEEEKRQLLYNDIMEKKLHFKENENPHFKTLVSGLLSIDPTKRLKGEEVKRHPFFNQIPWDLVRKKRCPPPFVPDLASVHYLPNDLLAEELLPDPPSFLTTAALLPDWEWTNPAFPQAVTSEEEDILFFTSQQAFPKGIEVFQRNAKKGKVGKIIFSIKELPLHQLMFTQKGSPIERKEECFMIGLSEIPIKND